LAVALDQRYQAIKGLAGADQAMELPLRVL
jgi:hypothetical protein